MDNQKTKQLRQQQINSLKDRGLIKSAQVEKAFQSIPRHIFVPNVSPEEAYLDKAISTKNSENLGSISSSSAPGLMAQMLELLDLQKGQKVLEIGAGTGFNAALISQIIGLTGKVVTIDIDQDIVDDAKNHINQMAINNVEVICRDGAIGDAKNAPFDRIIMTVGVPDIFPSWLSQLKEGGLLVVPLELSELETIYNNQPVIVFKKVKDHLESLKIIRSGFMRLRGSKSTSTKGLHTLPGISDLEMITPIDIDSDLVEKSLSGKSTDQKTEISVKYQDLFGLHLWFALRLPNYCHISTSRQNMSLARFFTRDGKSYSTVGICSENSISILSLENEISNNDDSAKIIIKTFGDDLGLEKLVFQQILSWENFKSPFSFNEKWEMRGVKIKAYLKKAVPRVGRNAVRVEKHFVTLLIHWN